MQRLQPVFTLVPKFMKTFQMKVFLMSATGVTGYMWYKNRNETKMEHPLVGEALKLLESKKDVRELIGTPLYVVHSLQNRASTGSELASFSYKVKGPRGTLNIELSGVSQPLDQIGLTREAKEFVQKNNPGIEPKTTLDELNYVDFDIPGMEYYAKLSNVQLSKQFDDPKAKEARAAQELPSDLKFWKIDYLYCNVDENMRIMVHPDKATRSRLNSTSNFITKRENLDDLAQEKKAKLKALDLYREDLSQEELDEISKFKTQEMYRKVGFKRWYMLMVAGFCGITAYTMYVTNKRKALINSFAVSKVKNVILGHSEIKAMLGNKVVFFDTTIGALINGQADYEMMFYGYKHSGRVSVSSFYDEAKSDFILKDVTAKIFDADGNAVKEYEIMKNKVNTTGYKFEL